VGTFRDRGSLSTMRPMRSVGQLGAALGPLTGTTERIGRIVDRLPRSRKVPTERARGESDPN